MHTRWRLAKNAAANLIRGGMAGLVSIFLPAVLIRHMSQINYSVWVLVLQVSAYSSYLDFGLQTAVGRYVAVANERQDAHQRDSIFSTAFVGLSVASLAAIVALIAVASTAGMLFPNVPTDLLPSMRIALLIVGSSIALGLPSSAWSGIFIGIQRNELVAAVVGASKLISASALILASIYGASLQVMACIVAAVNLASYAALFLLTRRFSNVTLKLSLVQKSVAHDLLGYCSSLTIWSFATLLVNGLDLLFVGRFELGALIPYALATSLITFITGVQTAIFGAAMPHAAVLHAQGDSAALGKMVISTTRIAVVLLVLTGIPILIYATPLFRLWVGQQYADHGRVLLMILMIASMVRLVGMPYSVVLIGSGQQKLVTLSPLIEGFTNLFASIILGMKFGAIGIATGTLIGGLAGMAGHVFYNMPRTKGQIAFLVRTYLISSVCVPALASAPLIALLIYSYRISVPSPQLFATVLGLTLFLFAIMFLRTEDGRRRVRRDQQSQPYINIG